MSDKNLQSAKATRGRPVDAGLWHSRLPVGAVASILHRITGIALTAGFPVALYGLSVSLREPVVFDTLRRQVTLPAGRALLGVAVWFLAHHLYTGVRHLLLDLDIGSDLRTARTSAYVAIILALVTAAIVAIAA